MHSSCISCSTRVTYCCTAGHKAHIPLWPLSLMYPLSILFSLFPFILSFNFANTSLFICVKSFSVVFGLHCVYLCTVRSHPAFNCCSVLLPFSTVKTVDESTSLIFFLFRLIPSHIFHHCILNSR